MRLIFLFALLPFRALSQMAAVEATLSSERAALTDALGKL
jgi:hypothetical protein